MSTRKFKSINVNVYQAGPPSLIVVEWEWEESGIPLSRYTLDIYRGESPENLKLLLSGVPGTAANKYEDMTAQLLDKHRVYHYKVVAHDSRYPNQPIESPVSTWEGDLDLVGLYVVEEHEFLFKEVIGVPVLIFKQQTSGGMKCPDCWDPIAKRIKKSNCTTCHGTGFTGDGVGGYYNPTYKWVDIAPDPEIVQVTQWGRTQPTQTDIFMTNYPRISVGDVFVELMTDKRWKVAHVRDTEKNRSKLLQIVRLDQIEKDQIEYKIPIDSIYVSRARTELNERKQRSEF